MRRLWILGCILCLGACAAESPGTTEEAIYGGTGDAGDPNVVLIFYSDPAGPVGGSSGFLCTGSMIGKRTVLTAAHCVEENVVAGRGNDGFIFYGGNNGEWRTDLTKRIPLAGARFHRDYDPAEQMRPRQDVAVVYLTADAPLDPVVLNDKPLEPLATVGTTRMRAVGWGDILTDGAGTKRQAMVAFAGLENMQNLLAGGGTTGSCHGDSGGPLFMQIDGVEKQVGITSFGPITCNAGPGYWARVDKFLQSFILEAVDNFEGPCKSDGICVTTGCRTPDPDCDNCGFDLAGTCNPACDVPDQNCPKGKDPGVTCATDLDCESRICQTAVDDPRVTYCSKECIPAFASTTCFAEQTCQHIGDRDICVYAAPSPTAQGAHCAVATDCRSGLCEPTKKTCAEACDPAQANACPAGLACIESTIAPHICGIAPPDTGGGCSTAGGGPSPLATLLVGLAAVVSLRRRSRRR